MEYINGGVTAAKGYSAAAAMAGIKYKGRTDMALVFSEKDAVAAGTFTTNVVKASPVKRDIKILDENECVRAVVLNSGIANACTGTVGDTNNELMASYIAEALGIDAKEVLTASTGVIGYQLPLEPLKKGAVLLKEALGDSLEKGHDAACAIMTTDTISKEAAVEFEISGKKVRIGGMSKGSGMIHPDMATMLGVVTSDVAISKEMLSKAVKADVVDSFNMISVDRDTSTNDSLMVLANGLAGNDIINTEGEDFETFKKALAMVTIKLAKMMAGDGEGATKLFTTKVINAADKASARKLAKSVITSNLVKTAVFGCDANWGRIVCALGYSKVDFDPENIDLYIEDENNKILLFTNGMATDYSEEEATKILSAKEVIATVDMKMGSEEATAYGCDLTYDYVKINGDYRS